MVTASTAAKHFSYVPVEEWTSDIPNSDSGCNLIYPNVFLEALISEIRSLCFVNSVWMCDMWFSIYKTHRPVCIWAYLYISMQVGLMSCGQGIGATSPVGGLVCVGM